MVEAATILANEQTERISEDDFEVQPFRLLDLPLELQRRVFRKCFEEPWSIEAVQTYYPKSLRPYGYYETDLPLAIFLVNRHCYNEARETLYHNKGGRYIARTAGQVYHRPHAWFDGAIELLDIHGEDNQEEILRLINTLKLRFTNLARIDIICGLHDYFPRVYERRHPEAGKVKLSDVLREKFNQAVMRSVDAYFGNDFADLRELASDTRLFFRFWLDFNQWEGPSPFVKAYLRTYVLWNEWEIRKHLVLLKRLYLAHRDGTGVLENDVAIKMVEKAEAW